jgi:Zn-dependent protease
MSLVPVAGVEPATFSLQIWRSEVSQSLWAFLIFISCMNLIMLLFLLLSLPFWCYPNFAYRLLTALTERLPWKQERGVEDAKGADRQTVG